MLWVFLRLSFRVLIYALLLGGVANVYAQEKLGVFVEYDVSRRRGVGELSEGISVKPGHEITVFPYSSNRCEGRIESVVGRRVEVVISECDFVAWITPMLPLSSRDKVLSAEAPFRLSIGTYLFLSEQITFNSIKVSSSSSNSDGSVKVQSEPALGLQLEISDTRDSWVGFSFGAHLDFARRALGYDAVVGSVRQSGPFRDNVTPYFTIQSYYGNLLLRVRRFYVFGGVHYSNFSWASQGVVLMRNTRGQMGSQVGDGIRLGEQAALEITSRSVRIFSDAVTSDSYTYTYGPGSIEGLQLGLKYFF